MQTNTDPIKAQNLNQDAAIEAVLHGTRLERGRLGLGALRELMKDPENTEMVFVLALALNRERVGILLGQLAASESGSWLLDNKPEISSKTIDYDDLRALPEATLGREYVRFLDDNNLDADFFEEPPGLPPMIGFIAKRMRQVHDVWHTVTGYGSDPAGEVELQAFTFAQVGVPSSALIAISGSVRGVLTRDISLPGRAFRAYLRGKRAGLFTPVIWENQWERPLADVRAELGL